MDSEHNPYQAPNRTDGVPLRPRSQRPAPLDSATLAVYAQLLLRVFGVLMIVEGLGLAVFSVAFGLATTRDYVAAGYSVQQGLFNPHSVGYGCWAVVSLAGGLYLTIGGRWLIAALFVPPAPFERDEPVAGLGDVAEFRDSAEV